MASIALMGLLTGFAKGAAQRVEKEREENEELIKTRLKMAAVTKQKRDAEAAARRTALTERYSIVSPYLDGSESEEQKLALISNEAIAKDFAERKSRGDPVNLQDYIVTNKDKIPTGFKSVQQYIDSISAAPAPIATEQMQSAFGSQRGFLGARTGVSAGRAEKIASSLGSGATAAQLLAYENAPAVSAEPLMDVARINAELYPKNIKKPEDQLDHIQGKVVQFRRQFGPDDPKTLRAIDELDATTAAIKTLSPDQFNWNKRRPELVGIIASPTTSVNDKIRAENELRRGDGIDKNMLSASDLSRFAQTAGTNAVARKFGSLVDKSIAVVTNNDGSTSYKYIGDPGENVKKEIDSVFAEAVRNAAKRYFDPVTQTYINDAYRTAIESLLAGIGTAPAAPVPSPNVAQQPATRITPPAAAAAPVAGAGAAADPLVPSRTETPMTLPPNIAVEREKALKAIAEGRDPDMVRQLFKERTGRDL